MDLNDMVPHLPHKHNRVYSQISLKKPKKIQSVIPSSRQTSSVLSSRKEPDYVNLVNIYENYLQPGTNTVEKTLKKSKKILKKYNGYEF